MTDSMTKTKEFLAKLSKINFTDAEQNSLISEDWNVKLKFKIMSGVHATFRVQIVVQVQHKGVVAATWGSDSNEVNDAIALWFLKEKTKAQDIEWKETKAKRIEAENHFKAL